jgi:Flp pilus assembly protein TadD
MLDNSDDELSVQASRLQNEGDFRGALELWREIARKRPDPEALCGLANAAQEIGEMEEAEAALLNALNSDPSLRLPYMMLCRAATRQGRWDEAEFRARQALRIEEEADAYNLLGVALDGLGRAQDAEAAFLRGIELDASNENLYFNFGRLLWDRDPVKAEGLFCKAIELNPDDGEAHRQLGDLLLTQKVMDEAEYHLRRAVELEPADPWAHLNLGLLLWKKKDIGAADAEFRWAYEAAPHSAVAMSFLADGYVAREEWSKAEVLYHRALAAEPDNIFANYGLARMYALMGKTGLARTYLGRVLLLNPDHKLALEAVERIADEYGDLPRNLVARVQRRRPRWQRRQDPGAI